MDTSISLHPNLHPIVLIVDDDLDNLILLNHQVIVLLSCSVLRAADGQTALALARAAQPDLILLDLMLPDLDGFEIIRQLKQDPKTRSIPVIAVSAMAQLKDRERAFIAGCHDYVCKPYELEHLEAAIQHCLVANRPLERAFLPELLDAS